MNRKRLRLGIDYEEIDDHRYKYRILKTQYIKTGFTNYHIKTKYFELSPDGTLIIYYGYCWDGATCAIDTPSFMRSSLVHDVFYQMLRDLLFFLYCRFDQEEHDQLRLKADIILIEISKEDGMWLPRRWWVMRGVRLAAGTAAKPDIINFTLDLSRKLPATRSAAE